MRKRTSVADVVKGRICCGCGACAVVCGQGAVTIEEGRHYNYARVDEAKCVACGQCAGVCPSQWMLEPEAQGERQADEGAVMSRWLSHARDEGFRREAASGGFVTGLLVDLLERGGIDGAVTVRADEERAFYNKTAVATTREEILACRGSRYAPASACVGLTEVAERPGRYAFVGKGCEIAALRRLQGARRVFKERVVLAIGLFCAQTPARSRTVELVRRIGARPGDVTRVDYRGGGWPGRFRARGETEVLAETEYRKAWDFLAGGMPALRCFVCGDGMAAEADLSVGDPWGLPEKERTREGRTYVIARTEIGGHAAAEGMLGRAIEFENAPEEWAAGRAAIQERRAETARRRLTTYRAVFRFAGVARALAENGLAALPTVIRQRLKTGYY